MLEPDPIEALKALADETRLRILSILEQAGELCACEIEAVLDLNQSNASRHLAKLRHAGLVHANRQGHWVHYRLAAATSVMTLAEPLLRSLRDANERFRRDLARLDDYRSSGHTCETIGEWSHACPPARARLAPRSAR